MFGFGVGTAPKLRLACYLSESAYALLAIDNESRLIFVEHHDYELSAIEQMANDLAEDIAKHALYGIPCQLILAPCLYQLILMDALDVPENEMAKALRWRLKGLIDYPLNDIAVDAFIVPPHGVGLRRKKAFVAVTPLSLLQQKIAIFERCLLNIKAISIAELSLLSLLSQDQSLIDTPVLVISYDDGICQLHIYYQQQIYLERGLSIHKQSSRPEDYPPEEMLLEIQRSMDYCLGEFKLPEPRKIFFTPSFYKATALLDFLRQELKKEISLIDINQYLFDSMLAEEVQAKLFYAVGAALMTEAI